MTKPMFLATCLVIATLVSGMLLVERFRQDPRQWDTDPLSL